MFVSIIIPCFNEEQVILETYDQLSAVLVNDDTVQYELLFIDDGSRDGTGAILRNLAYRDSRVRLIAFSRNFGHQAAVSAGIRHCRGELAAIIDADLQDPPQVIPEMIRQLRETGSNVVYGVRKRRRGETLFKRASARLFYLTLNQLSEVPLPLNTGDFRVIDRKIIDTFNGLKENNKYVRGLISWIGFKQTPFYYERSARFAGETKYTLGKMLRFASTGIFYFSKKPLKLATSFGALSVAAGLLLSCWILYCKLATANYLVSGWTSIILVVIYFGGVQLLTIGILGHYVGSLFDEVKKRPEYIVDEVVQLEECRLEREEIVTPTFAPSLGSFRRSLPKPSAGVAAESHTLAGIGR